MNLEQLGVCQATRRGNKVLADWATTVADLSNWGSELWDLSRIRLEMGPDSSRADAESPAY